MTTPIVDQLKIMIFADGANLKGIVEAAANPLVEGFTTNPTLMRAAGVEKFGQRTRRMPVDLDDAAIEALIGKFERCAGGAQFLLAAGQHLKYVFHTRPWAP